MCQRLPQNYIPTHYDLFIHFEKQKSPFTANVSITFEKNQDADQVILNVEKNITINQITQNDIQLKYEVKYPQLTIYRSKEPDQDISAYPIKIEYLLKPIKNDFEGLYVYKDSYLTQFETHYARKMLPCFDEPCIRSSFTVRIQIPSALTGISNMPSETTEEKEDEKIITFLPTPKMCSYLLCICVGDFNSIQGVSKSGIPVILYGESHKYQHLRKYLKYCVFALDWMEEKMDVKYELPHLQFISHEGVKLGMENYGLIALNECSSRPFMVNVLTIMHEVAHLWFGDLVSTKWWDSVWLNEGFAQYFEYLILRDLDLHQREMAINIFIKFDGLRCLTYYDNKKVVPKEDEIKLSSNVLKSIIYIKGAFVLKMFSDMVGEENFFRVCSNWLKKYKNKAAVVSEFIQTANETLNSDYSNFFNTWLREVGFPLLNISENYSENGEITGITIVQSSHTDSIYIFNLAIVYAKGDDVKRVEILINKKETVFECDFDWMIVNDNVDSLCAVIYSNVLLQNLNMARLEGKLSENDELLVYLSPEAVSSEFKIDAELKNLCNQFASEYIPYRESFFGSDALYDDDSYSCSIDNVTASYSIDDNDNDDA